jgi:hypothetical protein
VLPRRQFLLAGAGAGLYACAEVVDDHMTKSFGNPPWHLWGTSSSNFSIEAATLGNTGKAAQLARIRYKRPENWRFAFQCVVQQVSEPTNDFVLDVYFDLIFGVGRSKISIDAFEHYSFGFAGGLGLVLPHVFWSTEVVSPPRIVGSAASSGVCDHIVASDIQCTARVVLLGSPPNTMNLEVTAQFAPNVHVRPDWDKDPHSGQQFSGGEDEGQ